MAVAIHCVHTCNILNTIWQL